MKYSPLLFLLLACSPSPEPTEPIGTTDGIDYERLAREICTCMTPLLDLNGEVMAAARGQDYARAQALIARIDAVTRETEACAKRAEAEYGSVEATKGPEAERAFREHCPRMVELLRTTGVPARPADG